MPAPRENTDRVQTDRRARARRNRNSQLVVVAIAVVVGVIAAALGTRPPEQARALVPTTTTTAAPKPAPAKTVLFAHVGSKHNLDLLAVLGIDTGGTVGSVVFVPTTTLVQVPAFDTQPLLSVTRLGWTSLLATTVSNALGLHFDQVILTGNKSLTAMIAPSTRLSVTFVRSVQVDDAGGTLAFTAGRARISAADATRLLIGKDNAGSVEHLVTVQAVWQAWFDRLRVPSVASATVHVSSSTRSLVRLAQTEIGFDTLPVDVLSSGSVARYEVRQPDADTLVRHDFPWAMFAAGKRPRVEVLNGTGAIALTQAVAQKIVPAGGEITLTGNVPGFGVKHTQVVYYRVADLPAARRLAAALGVGSVALGNVPIDVVDLTVVVGSDFHRKRS
jgi:LytR cell envelope-related transcriptional attenuator